MIPPQILDAVCRIPSERSGWQSWPAAVRRSGYPSVRDQITPLILADYLEQHPEHIQVWEGYSLDKRTSGGWYLLRENGSWRVGSLTISRPDDLFASSADACAEFMLREIE